MAREKAVTAMATTRKVTARVLNSQRQRSFRRGRLPSASPSAAGSAGLTGLRFRRLRVKLEDDPQNPSFVTTVWGFGYKWEN